MDKKRSSFERLISLLQGVSWAFVLIGALSFYSMFSPFGLFMGLIGAFFGSLGGLFFLVILEIAQIQIDKLAELKKQTRLMEKMSNTSCEHEKVPHN